MNRKKINYILTIFFFILCISMTCRKDCSTVGAFQKVKLSDNMDVKVYKKDNYGFYSSDTFTYNDFYLNSYFDIMSTLEDLECKSLILGDTFTSVEIYDLKKWNVNTSIGSDISSKFQILSSNSIGNTSISNFINKFQFLSYKPLNGFAHIQFYFSLLEYPDLGQHQFVVKIKSNNKTYLDTTALIYLKN